MTESSGPEIRPSSLRPAREDIPVPDGYGLMPLVDPFEAYVGPFFERMRDGPSGPELMVAFRVDERHLNGAGSVHGGMLMTFADAALGTAIWRLTSRVPSVTVSMQIDFLKPARLGDLVETAPILTRRTRSILFVRATFEVGGEPVLHATSLWKVLGA
ncbi:MAG: PaaI family thioesterase [Alphaproteobacteria bacterium]|nr:PaaI family thioesterase [Alphaproteobacteria bacterium]